MRADRDGNAPRRGARFCATHRSREVLSPNEDLRAIDAALARGDRHRLADARISIGAFLQKEPAEGTHATDIIMLTHGTIEKRVDAAIAQIERLDTALSPVTRIRVEDLA